MTPASRKFKSGATMSQAGLRKRSISLAGHATSLALEPEFWAALEAMAAAKPASLAALAFARRG